MTRSPYRSTRARAWRNLMVAATNAAVEQGLILLEDPSKGSSPGSTQVFRFAFPGGLDAVGSVADIGWGEVSIHAALNPAPDAERWIVVSNADDRVGDAYARGWLERRNGLYLQSSASQFFIRRALAERVAAVSIEPLGYRDHGAVIL